MKNYCIREDYKTNLDKEGWISPYFDTDFNADNFQVESYRYLANKVKTYNSNSLLDIGCGFATKLVKFVYPHCRDITGIDTRGTIDVCNKRYNIGTWFADDIENPSLKLHRTYDVVSAIDVIEHLNDPDKLFDYIERFCHPNTWIIISTPDRDVIRSKSELGPPENRSHIREWNIYEFTMYVKGRFEIIEIVSTENSTLSKAKGNIIVTSKLI